MARTNKIRKACERCAVKKTKCGGGTPCRPCGITGAVCTYLLERTRRGRKSKKKLAEKESSLAGEEWKLKQDADELEMLLQIAECKLNNLKEWERIEMEHLTTLPEQIKLYQLHAQGKISYREYLDRLFALQ